MPSTSSPHGETLRRDAVAATPWWYSPWLHLAFPSLVGAAVIAFALAMVDALALWQLAVIPLGFLVANFVEWRAHKKLLHHRAWYAPVLYDQHTPKHHQIYTTDSMEVRDPRELRLVLIPAYGILLILLSSAPMTYLLWRWAPNVAWLWLATNTLYILSYEWLHLAYHAPKTSFAGRNRWIRKLRRHHAIHHDLHLMQEKNFNVTVPLFDWILGTMVTRHDDDDTSERMPAAKGAKALSP